ncbi:MAG: sulfite exporter TauE/SafE family protein [Steroidobacteraceae bacterium]
MGVDIRSGTKRHGVMEEAQRSGGSREAELQDSSGAHADMQKGSTTGIIGGARRWPESREILIWLLGGVTLLAISVAVLAAPIAAPASLPWWAWIALLFVVTFCIGIVSVLAGVGGGVLFVPIVSGFFPFHLDFVRGAALLVALATGLASSPRLLRIGLANLRLALPFGLVASASAIFGAALGVSLPTNLVQIALGLAILGIVWLQWRAKKSERPDVPQADALSAALHINGIYIDIAARKKIEWKIHRTLPGLLVFAGIGVVAGMFGLGAGWANVPALNLLLGAPLKVAVGTSMLLSTVDVTAAAWVYLNQGAVLAVVTVPSIVAAMLGAFIGVRLLTVVSTTIVRKVVILTLIVAGLRALLTGLGI